MRLLCCMALLSPTMGHAQTNGEPATVVIVVVGDPAPELLSAAHELEALIGRSPDLRLPSDPELRRALMGEAPTTETDGLAQARQLRRLLGWDGTRDEQILARMARVVDARAALVVRAEHGTPYLEVFSGDAGRFFDRRLALVEVEPGAITDFIHRRLEVPSEPAHMAEAPPNPLPLATDALPPPRTSWIRQNWAYLVGGVLFAGVVSYAVWRRQEEPLDHPLMLRIIPEAQP